MSFMAQCYSVTIYQGLSVPGYDKEVVYGINAIYKHYIYIYKLMSNVQQPGFKKLIPRCRCTLAPKTMM